MDFNIHEILIKIYCKIYNYVIILILRVSQIIAANIKLGEESPSSIGQGAG